MMEIEDTHQQYHLRALEEGLFIIQMGHRVWGSGAVLPGEAAVAAISTRTSVREFISAATGELVIVRSLVPLLYTPRFYGF